MTPLEVGRSERLPQILFRYVGIAADRRLERS